MSKHKGKKAKVPSNKTSLAARSIMTKVLGGLAERENDHALRREVNRRKGAK